MPGCDIMSRLQTVSATDSEYSTSIIIICVPVTTSSDEEVELKHPRPWQDLDRQLVVYKAESEPPHSHTLFYYWFQSGFWDTIFPKSRELHSRMPPRIPFRLVCLRWAYALCTCHRRCRWTQVGVLLSVLCRFEFSRILSQYNSFAFAQCLSRLCIRFSPHVAHHTLRFQCSVRFLCWIPLWQFVVSLLRNHFLFPSWFLDRHWQSSPW